MAVFPSEEWITDLAERAAEVSVADHVPLTLEQRIDGEPAATWHLEIAGGRLRVGHGPAQDCTVWLTTTRPIAEAIHGGALSAQRAFLDGDLRIGGDVGALLAQRATLEAIAASMARRSETAT